MELLTPSIGMLTWSVASFLGMSLLFYFLLRNIKNEKKEKRYDEDERYKRN